MKSLENRQCNDLWYIFKHVNSPEMGDSVFLRKTGFVLFEMSVCPVNLRVSGFLKIKKVQLAVNWKAARHYQG